MSSLNKAVVLCFIVSVFIVICEAQGDTDHEVATPTVEALYPKGFRVTLKEDGYTFFGFRGKINEPLHGLDDPDIFEDIPIFNGNKGVYRNNDAVLKVGDTIYYWIFVRRNKKRYFKTDLQYTVTGFVNEDGTPASSPPPVPTSPTVPSYHQDSSISFPEDPQNTKFGEIMQGNCEISKTMVGKQNTCKDQMLFSEEFATTSLRALDKWDVMIQFPGEPDYPFNIYNPDKTVTFEDGSLVISPVLTEAQHEEGYLHQTLDLGVRCTSKPGTTDCIRVASGAQIIPPVTTAKITTRRSFSFTYGRVEVRAKLPTGSWLIPEINLEPTDNVYGPSNYASGLMRVAFVRGNPALAKKLYGGPVLSASDPFRSALLQEKIGIDNWHKDFHNYTMVWKPDGINLLVDNVEYGMVNPGGGFFEVAKKNNVAHAAHWQKGSVMAPLDQMFHVTLGLRVGGVNDFSDDLESKPWKNSASKAMFDFWRNKDSWQTAWYDASLRVDYVRVYAL